MGVTEKPVTFESHGKSFATKEEASRYDTLVNARRAFAQARRNLERAFAQTWKTADGELFTLGHRGYFRISKVWGQPPRLQTIHSPYWYDFEIRHDTPILRWVEPGALNRPRYEEHDIRELYAFESNARAQLVKDLDVWIEEMRIAHVDALDRARRRGD